MQKNVVIILVTNLSKTVRIRSHFEGEYLRKITEFSMNSYLSSIAQNLDLFCSFSSSIYTH